MIKPRKLRAAIKVKHFGGNEMIVINFGCKISWEEAH
jgi:hypothetical protein